jgi:hypothetical protein
VLALETYLRELRDIRSLGAAVDETAYYPALATLLTEVGKKLKPKVRCVMGLKDLGAGFPDGGLFTEEQFDKKHTLKPLPGQLPSRGVIEVKPVKKDAWFTAEGEQVSRYWGKYRQVLVTNYRDFLLVGQDAEGKPAKLEPFHLAESEKAFWAAAATPHTLAQKVGGRFEEYLLRVMRHAAQLAAPEDVAWFLASYARDARARIEGVELPALAAVRTALEEALGLKFEGAKGEHFFRSSLVQTLFYGVFSAWVLWAKQHSQVGSGGFIPPQNNGGVKPPLHATPPPRFDWYTTARYLRVPMISKLFHLVADPQELEALKLTEVLDWATLVLNRVDRRSFFDRFQESHAVQYFYEPFLEAFDPELRKELGVWYTPPEVVKYMVERVDTVLRQELGLPLGLADKNVYVLDPCCGTGSYLVEVLDRIHRTLKERGEDALLASDLKEAAQKRVFGFEILPAPFVVSHLQLGLLLQNLGAPLDVAPGFSPARAPTSRGATHGPERVGVYLTNALTGWEPPKGPKQRLIFPELEEERDAAEHVKREVPILVILGNPPYNSFAGIASMEEERDLTEAYRTTQRAPAPQGQGLNDLYVRFYRMAERRIVEKTGRGVVCLISNYSWLDGLSFTGMRERYLEAFDRIWIDCLNGDKYRTGKLTPEGDPDPSVFSTEWNPEGIQVGTAITLLVCVGADQRVRPKEGAHTGAPLLRFRHLWGKTKRQQLLDTAVQDGKTLYEELTPPLALGLPFVPAHLAGGYVSWPSLPDLFPVSFPGVKTSRDPLVVDIDRERLLERMEEYFNPKVSHDEMRRVCPVAMTPAARFEPETVREYLLRRGFKPENIVRYCYRPLDARWLYWESETKLLDEKRTESFAHVFEGNTWLAAVQQNRKNFDPPIVARSMCSLHVIERGANMFPLYLADEQTQGVLGRDQKLKPTGANLTSAAVAYLGHIQSAAPELFYHAIAILHAPAYRAENSGALRQDWPRIPLPDSRELLLASAELGKQIAALLDTETPFDVGARHGVPLQRIAAPSRVGGGSLKDDQLAVTAGWGHAGKGGVTMPGKGKIVERDYTESERKPVPDVGARHGVPLLGDRTLDVYLNDVAYWSNIPIRVWEYTIGGYQVIKKWLSYREEKLLGRALSKDEVRYVQEMARRIGAILSLEPALDANYRSVKEHAYTWTT